MSEKEDKIHTSPNFRNGTFHNASPTPVMAEDVSMLKVMGDFLRKPKSVTPPAALQTVKTDLKTLRSDKPLVIWFGHSSYLLHLQGITILVDPVFNGYASPVPFMIKAFAGADAYTAADLPAIDMLVITHNHYDHLDKQTIKALAPKVKAFYTPLGVGKTLQSWSVPAQCITELDWWETVVITDEITLTATPARHFSGRGLKRNNSLWASYVLKAYGYSLYLGGDSGYDTHFRETGDRYGPFDLAMLECGQYNTSWPKIHMMPEETVQASLDLKADLLLPVHWAKFPLAYHPWDEPIKRVVESAAAKGVNITTPRIGEPVMVGRDLPRQKWWEAI